MLPYKCVRYFGDMVSVARQKMTASVADAPPETITNVFVGSGAAGAARPIMPARMTEDDATSTEFVDIPESSFFAGSYRLDWHITHDITRHDHSSDCSGRAKRLLAILACLYALHELSTHRYDHGALRYPYIAFVASPNTSSALEHARRNVEAARERTSSMQYVHVRLLRIGSADDFNTVVAMLRNDHRGEDGAAGGEDGAAGGGGGGAAGGGGGGAADEDDGILVFVGDREEPTWNSIERYASHYN